MKKLFVLMMLAGMAFGPVSVFAEMSNAVPGSPGLAPTGTGTAVPGKVPVAPRADLSFFDDDTSDDEIVQLNNLTVVNVDSTSLPAVITVSHDVGIRCMKYATEASASGLAFPCPVPPSALYKIKVDTDTRLLLRTRTRAALADFAVGDHVNIYGFMDRDTNAVEALIVRNIDKPVVRKYIQLNNMEVLQAPGAVAPTGLVVAQKDISPCLDYGQFQNGGMPFPCPLGIETKELKMHASLAGGTMVTAASANAAGSTATAASAMPEYYPMLRKYEVRVTAETKVVNRNRVAMPLSHVEQGDRLNIYGYYRPGEAVLTALVIRDLSKPAAEERAVLRVGVSARNIVCAQAISVVGIMAPCGILYNATVAVYGPDSTVVAKGLTERGIAAFENLRPGTYTIVATAPGYERGKLAEVVVNRQEVRTVTIELDPVMVTDKVSVHALEGLGGVVGTPYRATFEARGGMGSYSFAVVAGSLPPGTSLMLSPMPMAIACLPNTECSTFAQARAWVSGTPTVAGAYKFTIAATDARGARGQETFVAVVRQVASEELSVRVTTDKSAYAPGEPIQITLAAKNNSSVEKVLNFNTGCQTSYALHPVFSTKDRMICTMALTSVTIPAGETHTWTMTHTAEQYKLPPGEYKLEGTVLGYGSAFAPVVVRSAAGGNLPPSIGGISGPSSLAAGQTGTWAVKAYDPEHGQLSYLVTWGDEVQAVAGAAPSTAVAREMTIQTSTFTHAYSKAGTYTPVFIVTDSEGYSAKTSMTIRVGESLPPPTEGGSTSSGSMNAPPPPPQAPTGTI